MASNKYLGCTFDLFAKKISSVHLLKMFLNNPAPTRSILNNNNNENASSFHRSKSLGGGENNNNVMKKKTSFNENSVHKTPGHSKQLNGGNGQTTQRRRRALGDISNNRKGGLGGGSGKGGGGLVLKKQSTTTNTKNRTSQVKFSKTPSTKPSNSTNKSRLGGVNNNEGGGLKSINSKSKQLSSTNTQSSSSTDYDGIFEATTRWADDVNDCETDRSPYDLVPKEELDMVSNIRDEMAENAHILRDENDRLENERDEELFKKSIHSVHSEEGLGGDDLGFGINDDPLFDDKLPWETEEYNPAEERRLSGTDPLSLFGDILA